jgi:predicted phage terminase large subunit-like protein
MSKILSPEVEAAIIAKYERKAARAKIAEAISARTSRRHAKANRTLLIKHHEKYREVIEKAKSDRMYLANEILGYDFFPETHAELFAQYPAFKMPWQFEQRDVLVLWSRGHFKTTAAMVVLVIQAILIDPEITILIMQGNIKNTQERLKEIASHFLGTAKGSRFTEVFPEFCYHDDISKQEQGLPPVRHGLAMTKDSFVTPARTRRQTPQATVTVASPKTIKTGQHFRLGIFDDLVNDQNYRSRALLRKVQEDFDMCFPLIDPGCPRFVSGTRYAFGDLYDVIVDRTKQAPGKMRAEWRVNITTCWKDDNEPAGIPRFPQYQGKDGNTHGFSPEILWQIKQDSPSVYASQYLNKPMLESQQILTAEDMDAATILPHQAPPLSPPILFIDLAAEGDAEPDDSVIVIGKTDAQGIMYAVGGAGDKWNIPQLGAQVIKYALEVRPAKILIEETSSAKYFVEYLRMAIRDLGLNLPIDYIKINNQKGAKAIRIKAYAGHVKSGRLKFFVGLSYWAKLVKQSIQFQANMKHTHDDYPDTMALMCNVYAVRYLGIAPKQITGGPHDVYDVDEQGVIKRQQDMIHILEQEPMLPIKKQPEEIVTDQQTMGGDFAC